MQRKAGIGLSIVDVCVKDILKRFPLNPEGELQGLNWPDWLDAEIFNMGPDPAAVMEEGTEVLGHYEPMASPGRIVLHRRELAAFFWHQARDIFLAGYHVEANDLQNMCHMVVMKVYTHEQFHHFCDVARHLFGSRYDRMREEALAVTWSYFQMDALRWQWSTKEARLSSGIYRSLLPKLYGYRAPGYRDWVNYKAKPDFEMELIHYIGPASSGYLDRNGINMSEVLLKILDVTKSQAVAEEIM